MKASYDQNLPPSLIWRLEDVFPSSEHVRNLGMADADDLKIWEYAENSGFTIFSKGSDFQAMSLVHGHPPKTVRLGLGNASVVEIASYLRRNIESIHSFAESKTEAHLDLR